MREEVQRISRLVAEGKLTPEDAADLIDAFYASDRGQGAEEAEQPRQTPPPPPPNSGGEKWTGPANDPFRGIVDSIEKLTKEGLESVNWQEVSKQARESAKKGLETLKTGLEDLSKGKVHLGWLGFSETREITLPLTIGVGKTLRIENPCGDVRVVGGFDVGTVTAYATFRGANSEESRAKAAEFNLVIEETDHAVLIKQSDVTGVSVDFEVQVSGAVAVEVRSLSGDVQIMDTGLGARINSRSGDVHLRGLNGILEISSESGDISLEDVTSPQVSIDSKSGDLSLIRLVGNVNSRTASGDVSFVNGGGKVIAIESVSGDVSLDLSESITGNLNVRTVSGDIEVLIPDGNDARVNVSTMRGDVDVDLVLQEESRSEQRVQGRIGFGNGLIEISAITGDVRLGIRDSVEV